MAKRRSSKAKPTPRVFDLLDGLLLTDTHKEVARDNKVIGFVRMRPQQFLALTTLEPAHVAEIRREAKPLEQYNTWARTGSILNSPFLRVDRVTGQVCGHEGRHRAAALEKAEPGELMDVAITLRDQGCSTSRYYEDRVKPGKPFYDREKRYLGKQDVPARFCNEFDASLCERIDMSSWQGLYPAEHTRWADDLAGAGVGSRQDKPDMLESMRASSPNVEAQAAIKAAQKGQCRDAMKLLYDAAPHRQSARACTDPQSETAREFKLASVIVAGACTVNKSTMRMYARRGAPVDVAAGFGRAKRKPRRR